MKRAALAASLALILAGCGGPSSTNNTQAQAPPSAALKQRAFITNQNAAGGLANGLIDVIDASVDRLVFVLTTGGTPSMMVLSPDKKTLAVFDSATNALQVIDVAKQSVTGSAGLGDIARSIAYLSDNVTVLAALRNSGQVAFVSSTDGTIATNVAVPAVRTLVPSHSTSKVLAFNDVSRDTFHIIDISGKAATAVTNAALDFPIYGVFSSDDSKAYILSCGAECGGTTAKVSVLDVAAGTISQTVTVSAATTALLDGTRLYVAGTQGTAGRLDVVDVGTMTVSTRGVAISDGFHQVMALGSNNRLYIGARTCNNVTTGCLTIYNTSSNTATVDTPHGDVTGLQPITGRNVMYVIEGGELRIMQTTNDAEQSFPIIDIVGRAFDVKLVE